MMEVDTPSPQPTSSATAPAENSKTPRPLASDDNDPDPIVASYDVYTNAAQPAHRRLLILQHPNQKQPGPEHYRQVSEVRLKPRSGMLEVDVPISHQRADYDRDKGLKWGATLQRNTAAKSGGSHGLAGGFGIGVGPARGGGGGRRRAGPDGDDPDEYLDWSEAVRQDKVLRTQTLGGQFPVEAESNCRWMIGVFAKNQLHLTPATSVIQLRPQLHHVDASAEQDRLTRPREGGVGSGPSGGAGAGGKDGGAAAGGSGAGGGPARAITMTIKSAGGNELTTETMTDRLRVVQTEGWSKLKYADDSSDEAWALYEQAFMYHGAPKLPEEPAKEKDEKNEEDGEDDDAGKGKGKEVAKDKDENAEAEAEEEEAEKKTKKPTEPQPPLPGPNMPQLRGQWAEKDFLKAVSGMSGTEGQDGDEDGGSADDVVEVKKEDGAGTARPAAAAGAKGKAPAAPPATRRGPAAKGKSVSFKGTAGGSSSMDVD